MKEIRIYIVNVMHTDAELDDVFNWSDERFIEESERQGFVYSLKGFESAWNLGNIPYCDFSIMRIL